MLRPRLSGAGRALEIASGTGQHVAAFAAAFPTLRWSPSDPDPEARASIAAWTARAGVDNVEPPLDIDVTEDGWAASVAPGLAAVVAINLLHISPWTATAGLMAGTGQLLADRGLLFVYGAFRRDGAHISRSNVEFDAALRRRDREWGVRDVGEVAQVAGRHGLALAEVVAMPANNLSLVFQRAATASAE